MATTALFLGSIAKVTILNPHLLGALTLTLALVGQRRSFYRAPARNLAPWRSRAIRQRSSRLPLPRSGGALRPPCAQTFRHRHRRVLALGNHFPTPKAQ